MHIERFLRRSGLIDWDGDLLARSHLDPELCRTLHVAALLEQDTEITVRQTRALGLDRVDDVAAFLPVWEAEEAEHARALRWLLSHQRYRPPQPRPAAIPRRRRLVARVPASALGRLPSTGLVYCALGAAAEYLTILTYTEVTREVDDPAVGALLQDITRQEGRHFAFFLAAARARADAISPMSGRLARRALVAVWEPVGVPSLGVDAWTAQFGRLLGNARFRARIEGMDRVVDSIPHLDGLHLMETFLRERVPTG